jgi:hypothetical protein
MVVSPFINKINQKLNVGTKVQGFYLKMLRGMFGDVGYENPVDKLNKEKEE